MSLAALAAVCFVSAGPAPARAVDYDCSDFGSQAEAQGYLLPGDPYRLDADDDGIACEDLPCPCASGSPAPPSTPTPPPVPVPPSTPPPPSAPVPGPLVPEEEEVGAASYEAYVACSRGQYAPPARRCHRGARIGAFLRSPQDITYSVCVRLPSSREPCAEEQQAKAGTLYVNAVTTNALGRHKVIWYLPDRHIVRFFWLER